MQKNIKIKSNNLLLDTTLVTPEDGSNKALVIMFHGMTSSKSGYVYLGQHLTSLGISTLAVSLQAHGESEGDFSSTTANDLTINGIDVASYVKEELGNYVSIGLLGTSVGAHIASRTSKEINTKSIILRVPAVYSDPMLEMTCEEIMQDEGDVFKKISSYSDTLAAKSLIDFSGSLLLVPSENDTVIPMDIPTTLYDYAKNVQKKEMHIIKSATHGLVKSEWRNEFKSLVKDWFKETLL